MVVWALFDYQQRVLKMFHDPEYLHSNNWVIWLIVCTEVLTPLKNTNPSRLFLAKLPLKLQIFEDPPF